MPGRHDFRAVVAALSCVALIGCMETREQEDLAYNECILVGSTDTGRDVYCGKACSRPEVKKTYRCRYGTMRTITR